jgi:transcriptional regulator with XRE-family HTH domain
LEGQELAERHIALRERAGLTQEQEAKMAGVSPTTISGIESGKITRPHLKTLLKIARALDVDVGELRESGKVEAPPSQDRLFNGGSEERGRFIERCRRYVAARVAHYENRLALEKSSGPFAGYKRAQTLQDEAFEEFSSLVNLQGGELLERWLEDPAIPEAMKEELGFDLADAQEPFIRVVGRIGDRVKELAETQAEKEKAQQEKERQLEEMHEATRRRTA